VSPAYTRWPTRSSSRRMAPSGAPFRAEARYAGGNRPIGPRFPGTVVLRHICHRGPPAREIS
jgi:hypothetical protein